MKSEITGNTQKPLFASDAKGSVIYCNDAAHRKCAALEYGDNVFERYPMLADLLTRARATGARSFILRDTRDGDVLVDLTREAADNMIFYNPPSGSVPVTVLSYKEVAERFRLASLSSYPESARRITELYEALVSDRTLFFRGRELRPMILTDILSSFFDSALPRMRNIGHGLILRADETVTSQTIVFGDPYALMLMIAAMASAVGYAAEGDVVISAHSYGIVSTLTVSAKNRPNVTITDTASFGPHSPDVLFANMLARAFGNELALASDGDAVSFTLTVSSDAYRQSRLQNRDTYEFTLSSMARLASSVIS